uniref:1-phosphatidylinositol-3-phosphate 5-kinase n=1 Tax=Cannabis sativa TaxID=3483 RepID=A0A803NUX3_CANSA
MGAGISVGDNGTGAPSPGLSPSPSAVSLASTKSSCTGQSSGSTAGSTPYSTGPYQHVPCGSSLSPRQSSQMDSVTEQEKNEASQRSTNLNTVMEDSLPKQYSFCSNRSDEEDEYGAYHSDSETRHFSSVDGYYTAVGIDDIDQVYGSHDLHSDEENVDVTTLAYSPFPEHYNAEGVAETRVGEEADQHKKSEEHESPSYDEEKKNAEPVDFENNGLLWLPPELEDEEDDRSCEEHRNAMKNVVEGHFKALVAQLLQVENLPVGDDDDKEGWLEIITSLSWEAATLLKPDMSKGGGMDPGGYVKEMDHLKMAVAKIDAHHPDVLLVEKSVSRYAQDYLLAKNISLVLNIKRPLLERIARCTGAQIVSSIDHLTSPKLGYCDVFHVDKLLEAHGSAGQGGRKLTKTLMFFEGCPKPLGCTILLKGASGDELKKVKHVVQYGVFAAYHLALETSFLADEGASLPEFPLRSPITVALPDKPSGIDRSISTVAGFRAPTTRKFLGPEAVNEIEKLKEGVLVDGNLSTNHDPVLKLEADNSSCFVAPPYSPYSVVSPTSLPPLGHDSSTWSHDKLFSIEISKDANSLGPEFQAKTTIYEKSLGDSSLVSNYVGDSESFEEVNGTKHADENTSIANHQGTLEEASIHQFGIDINEVGSSKEDFPPSPSDHQSILVSLSTRCVWNGSVCERAHLFRIKYYGNFDKPLGRFLRDHLFDQSYQCRSCGMPSEAHVYCYTHRQGSLTISVKKFPEFLLPGEKEVLGQWSLAFGITRKALYNEVKAGKPAIDILEINKLRRQILLNSHAWDQRLTNAANLSKNSLQLGSIPKLKENSFSSLAKVTETNVTAKSVKDFSTCDSSLLETKYDVKLNDQGSSVPICEQGAGAQNSNEIVLAQSYRSEEEACLSSCADTNDHSELETGKQVRRTHSAGENPVVADLSDTLDAAWTVSENPKLENSTFDQGKVEAIRSVSSAVSLKGLENVEHSTSKNLSSGSQKHSSGEYHPVHISLVQELEQQSGARFLLTVGVGGIVLPVYDDEPTSIVAHTLISSEYISKMSESEKLKDVGDNSVSVPLFDSLNLLSLNSFDESIGESYRSFGSSDESILSTSGSRSSQVVDPVLYSKDLHIRISFTDHGSLGTVKYTVTCYYAKRFEALRRICCPSEIDFVRSLSRCKKWGAQGGKSNVFFAKTLDDRFIIKQVTKTELDSFLKFGPAYFKYLSESINTGSPTCLAKILGIYQVSSKHVKGGKESKMDVLVMENLLFRRNVTRLYDLKGSSRSRYNADTSGSNKVLLDQNLIEAMPTSPIFVGNKAKRLLERAVWNDTSFLASIDVMDYSLLVGVDEEKHELVLGIIDFMRQYTWDKHLETWVKTSGFLGGPRNTSPTVISPQQYKKRFRKAMTTYFLMVPDQWSPPTIIPSESQSDLRDENAQGP